MKTPIKTPVTLGTKPVREDGKRYNANMIYDADGNVIASLYGIPLHSTVEEIENGNADRWKEGLRLGQFIVDAINEKAGR